MKSKLSQLPFSVLVIGLFAIMMWMAMTIFIKFKPAGDQRPQSAQQQTPPAFEPELEQETNDGVLPGRE